jgi:hypothetical protein
VIAFLSGCVPPSFFLSVCLSVCLSLALDIYLIVYYNYLKYATSYSVSSSVSLSILAISFVCLLPSQLALIFLYWHWLDRCIELSLAPSCISIYVLPYLSEFEFVFAVAVSMTCPPLRSHTCRILSCSDETFHDDPTGQMHVPASRHYYTYTYFPIYVRSSTKNQESRKGDSSDWDTLSSSASRSPI